MVDKTLQSKKGNKSKVNLTCALGSLTKVEDADNGSVPTVGLSVSHSLNKAD